MLQLWPNFFRIARHLNELKRLPLPIKTICIRILVVIDCISFNPSLASTSGIWGNSFAINTWIWLSVDFTWLLIFGLAIVLNCFIFRIGDRSVLLTENIYGFLVKFWILVVQLLGRIWICIGLRENCFQFLNFFYSGDSNIFCLGSFIVAKGSEGYWSCYWFAKVIKSTLRPLPFYSNSFILVWLLVSLLL